MAYVQTTWVDNVTALSAANLNKIEQGVADAHAAAVWTNVDLNAATDYTVPWLAGARTMDLEIVGRVAATHPAAFMARPQGNGSTLNGRVVVNRVYINSVDGTETNADAFDFAFIRDNGYGLATINFGSDPSDVIVRATIDVVAGVSQSRKVIKGRGTTNTEIEDELLGSFLYSPVVPTQMLVQFNVNNAAAFTGRLRYLMRA